MKLMRAAVLKSSQRIEIEDIPLPSLNPDEVMVKVEACGICGSDIRYFKGDNPWSSHTLGINLPNPPNIIMGHEFAGEVLSVGDEIWGNLIGKRVVVLPYKICGECPNCKQGRHNLCENMIHLGHAAGWGKREYFLGGMAEQCPVWAQMCYPLPENISFQEASLLDLIGVAVHAVKISPMRPNIEVVIIGCGPIGNAIGQIVQAWGARRIFCLDNYEKSLQIVDELGIGDTINVREKDAVKYINRETGGKGVDLVFDTVGSVKTQKDGLKLLGYQGALINLVTNTQEISFKLTELSGERMIKSSANYLIPEFQIALDLLSSGKVKTTPMITHRFPLSKTKEAFDILMDKAKHNAFKVLIFPQKER